MLQVDDYVVKAIERVNREFHAANVDVFHLWKNEIVFTWFWWVGVALSVLPWVLWFRVRKKESSVRLLLAGSAVLILSSFVERIYQGRRFLGHRLLYCPACF